MIVYNNISQTHFLVDTKTIQSRFPNKPQLWILLAVFIQTYQAWKSIESLNLINQKDRDDDNQVKLESKPNSIHQFKIALSFRQWNLLRLSCSILPSSNKNISAPSSTTHSRIIPKNTQNIVEYTQTRPNNSNIIAAKRDAEI